MSGDGLICAARRMPGASTVAREVERQSCIAETRRMAAGADSFVRRGRITAETGSTFKRWLGALAERFELGLHTGASE